MRQLYSHLLAVMMPPGGRARHYLLCLLGNLGFSAAPQIVQKKLNSLFGQCADGENKGSRCPQTQLYSMGSVCHSNPVCYFGRLGKWNPLVLPWQAGSSSSRATKITHNEPQGPGVGCAMLKKKKKTKDNGWEQIIVTYAKERKNSILLVDGGSISWVGTGL